jgi:tRNA modification GTPase
MENLRRAIVKVAGWRSTGESTFLARERHLRALQQAQQHLISGRAAAEATQWELFAEELRLAQATLGSITGEVSADDLLGEIFAKFCIGK